MKHLRQYIKRILTEALKFPTDGSRIGGWKTKPNDRGGEDRIASAISLEREAVGLRPTKQLKDAMGQALKDNQFDWEKHPTMKASYFVDSPAASPRREGVEVGFWSNIDGDMIMIRHQDGWHRGSIGYRYIALDTKILYLLDYFYEKDPIASITRDAMLQVDDFTKTW